MIQLILAIPLLMTPMPAQGPSSCYALSPKVISNSDASDDIHIYRTQAERRAAQIIAQKLLENITTLPKGQQIIDDINKLLSLLQKDYAVSSQRSMSQLLGLLLSTDEDVRRCALDALADFISCNPRQFKQSCMDKLLSILNDDNPGIRKDAQCLLAPIAIFRKDLLTREVMQKVASIIDDPDEGVRVNILLFLKTNETMRNLIIADTAIANKLKISLERFVESQEKMFAPALIADWLLYQFLDNIPSVVNEAQSGARETVL